MNLLMYNVARFHIPFPGQATCIIHQCRRSRVGGIYLLCFHVERLNSIALEKRSEVFHWKDLFHLLPVVPTMS